MDRIEARARAMQLVYEWEMGGDGGEPTRFDLLEVTPGEHESDFMDAMAEGTIANADKLDSILKKYLRGWTIERLARVDLAIIRLALYELIATETPAAIIINEAIELSRRYSTDESGAFINGVLGNIDRDGAAKKDALR